MADLGVLLLLFTLLHFVVAQVPPQFILQVSANCSYTDYSAAVKVFTDLNIRPFALCRGQKVNFAAVSSSEHILEIFFQSGFPSPRCSFENIGTVYSSKLWIAWGQPGGLMLTEEEIYIITCTRNLHKEKDTPKKVIGESLIAPMELQGHIGDKTNNIINVTIRDVLNNVITDQSIPRGKLVYIMLQTEMLPDYIFGIQAASCTVMGKTSSYSVIRGGCGDGLVFDRNAGFVTSGLQTKSPNFEWFGLKFQEKIKFVCNVTLCDVNCDGSNCVPFRRKRSSPNTVSAVQITGESNIFDVVPPVGHIPVFERILVLDPATDVSKDAVIVDEHGQCLAQLGYMWITLSVTAIVVATAAISSIYMCFKRDWNSSLKSKLEISTIKM